MLREEDGMAHSLPRGRRQAVCLVLCGGFLAGSLYTGPVLLDRPQFLHLHSGPPRLCVTNTKCMMSPSQGAVQSVAPIHILLPVS